LLLSGERNNMPTVGPSATIFMFKLLK